MKFSQTIIFMKYIYYDLKLVAQWQFLERWPWKDFKGDERAKNTYDQSVNSF
jgi:hypothetical protein